MGLANCHFKFISYIVERPLQDTLIFGKKPRPIQVCFRFLYMVHGPLKKSSEASCLIQYPLVNKHRP